MAYDGDLPGLELDTARMTLPCVSDPYANLGFVQLLSRAVLVCHLPIHAAVRAFGCLVSGLAKSTKQGGNPAQTVVVRTTVGKKATSRIPSRSCSQLT